MALKDLFGKKSLKTLSPKNVEQIKEEVESIELIKNKSSIDNRFTPRVDFSKPENFAIYGSAKKYYEQALLNIHGYYPFDGSKSEKLLWEISSSYLDMHVYENLYPKSVGHARFGQNYARTGGTSNGYYNTTNKEYISFKGGPNTGSLLVASSPLHDNFTKTNSYDTKQRQENNLSFTGDRGSTVEFWLKKDTFSSESDKQVVFDLWNNVAHGQSSYCRFRVELHPNISGNENKIVTEIMSGTAGAQYVPLNTNITISDNKWHHYALTTKNIDNKISLNLYVDGVLRSNALTGSSISNFTGNIRGHVGSLVTSVSGTYGAKGHAKLSGSIDDLRFWRRERTKNQIGENWRTPVHGGSNTDLESGTDLTLYYKFNEGIFNSTSTNSTDRKVLDYSGRTTIGHWQGYTTASRKSTSAYVESGVLLSEEKDPVMYSNHPDVVTLSTNLKNSGSIHDQQNNSNLFHSLPSWIVDEDDSDLEYLTQIMSRYFDEVYLQTKSLPEIRYLTYPSGSEKAFPFGKQLLASRGLEMPELFVDSNILEYINDRSDKVVFEEKLNNTKNLIYQNIYNNLLYLFRSKGTDKSIRNLTRCFGINEDLLKLNMYSNNSLFTFEENYNQKSISKRYVDFNYPGRFDATIYQTSSANSSLTDQRAFVTGSTSYRFDANTLQGEFIFPKKHDFRHSFFFDTPFTQSSLFGINGASNDPSDLNWTTPNPDIRVYAIKEKVNSPNAYFKLTSSFLGISLTTDTYRGVYDNEKWNIAVRIKPKKYPYANFVSGSDKQYAVEFYGVNHSYDYEQNEFSLSADVTTSKGQTFFDSNKRVYLGARRNNNTGTVLDSSDVLASSIIYWNSYISNEEIKQHSLDPEIFGPKDTSKGVKVGYDRDIRRADSVVFRWDFNNISKSDATGGFSVSDQSSGSLSLANDYGKLGNLTQVIHPAKAIGFPTNSTKVINKEYISVAKKNLPEVVNGDHMVKVLANDDQFFSRNASPQEYFFSLEKSMYASISEAMLGAFSTIKDMNNLVGDPVNKYRPNYKAMEKLRQSFFLDVENEPDLEKFLEYYKWIDDSVTELIKQFIPLSADLVQSNANVIESHILERNKYQHQYPALEERMPSVSSPAKGAGDMKYAWSRGHAPISQLHSQNCQWWQQRAEKSTPAMNNSSPTPSDNLFASMKNTYLKERDKATVLVVDEIKTHSGDSKAVDYVVKETTFGTNDYLLIESSDVVSDNIDCEREVTPDKKIKFGFAVKKTS